MLAANRLQNDPSLDFMKVKSGLVVRRQKELKQVVPSTFDFASQFVPAGQILPPAPNNTWESDFSRVGKYFRARGNVPHDSLMDTERHALKHDLLASTTASSRPWEVLAASKRDYFRTLSEIREQSMSHVAKEQENRKLDCSLKHDVERMKTQQRIRSRIQLQLAAKQRPFGKSVELLGIDVDAELAKAAPTTPRFVKRTRELRSAPAESYLKHNKGRLEQDLVRRVSCIEALHDRQCSRLELESRTSTFYFQKKQEILNNMKTATPRENPQDSVLGSWPTVDELYRRRVKTASAAFASRIENEEVSRELSEMEALDDLVRKRLHSQKGQKPPLRQREVPYTLHSPTRLSGSVRGE